MSAEIIYGTDFQVRREREATEMEAATMAALDSINHIAETVFIGALADNFIIPRAFSSSTPSPPPKDRA